MNKAEHSAAKEADISPQGTNMAKRRVNGQLTIVRCLQINYSVALYLHGKLFDAVLAACFCCPQVTKKIIIQIFNQEK